MRGRQAVNSTLQLPIISTIHKIKKPLPWGDELKVLQAVEEGRVGHPALGQRLSPVRIRFEQVRPISGR